MGKRSAKQLALLNAARKRRHNKENEPEDNSAPPLLTPRRKAIKEITTRANHYKSRAEYNEKRFRSERRKTQRWQAQRKSMKIDLASMKQEIQSLQIAAKKMERASVQAHESYKITVENLSRKNSKTQEILAFLRKTNRTLKARADRAPDVLARAVQKARLRPRTAKLTKLGVYTPEARALARFVAKSGCAREKVGPLIRDIANFFGITVKNAMSRRSVGRAILEGGIAAEVQLGYELTNTESAYLVHFD